jgi:ArsR family transcriptional regulator, arsenate/arsenite/antimonite-responsive transcriptional repressor
MCVIISSSWRLQIPDKNLAVMERLFTSLADPTRLRLLNLMGDQEVCVCYFVEVLDAPQPTISRHLAYLRRNGLVAARREGKWMHYRIAIPENPFAQQILKDTLRWLAADKDMQRDRSRLGQACCSPQKFVRLEGAPVPTSIAETIR